MPEVGGPRDERLQSKKPRAAMGKFRSRPVLLTNKKNVDEHEHQVASECQATMRQWCRCGAWRGVVPGQGPGSTIVLWWGEWQGGGLCEPSSDEQAEREHAD